MPISITYAVADWRRESRKGESYRKKGHYELAVMENGDRMRAQRRVPCETVETIRDACELAEAGFDYLTTMNDVQIFRKRK